MKMARESAVALATIGLLAASIFFLHTTSREETPPPEPEQYHANDQVLLGSNKHSVADLISKHAIDAKLMTAHGSRGFSIIRSSPLRPTGDALEFVRSLLQESSSGNALATYEIFLATLDCKRLYVGGVDHVDAASDVVAKLSECESLLANPAIADADWLTKAAEQGSIEAMVMYSINPSYTLPGGPREYLSNPDAVQKWRESARHFLERAASSGSQDALLSLASAYKAGVIVEHDPVKQLAYALAAQKSSPIPGYQEAYQELRSSLTPLEIKRSEVLANVIYDKCCKEN